MSLFPYQLQGVDFLKSNRRAFLFDDPGLGKTAQALSAINANAGVIVICPKSVKDVWHNETIKWRPDLKPTVLAGRGSFRLPETGEVIIVNPDILPESFIWSIHFGTQVIVDEAHMFKSTKAKRSKTFSNLARATYATNGSIWMLTGTPILTSPMDLYGLLCATGMFKELYGTWARFVYLFRGYMTGYGYRWSPSPRPEALQPLLRYVMRRKREHVLPQLPTKIYETYPVDVTVKGVIRPISEDTDLEKKSVQMHLSSWRKDIALAKSLVVAHEFVPMFEDNNEQVVLFSAHTDAVELYSHRPKWGVITGQTPTEQRNEIVKQFQAKNLIGIAGTIGAMGVGLTLTSAHRVVFIDRDWTPAMNKQAEDRVCRIGQSRGVIVTDIVSTDPVDSVVAKVLAHKTRLLENTVEKM